MKFVEFVIKYTDRKEFFVGRFTSHKEIQQFLNELRSDEDIVSVRVTDIVLILGYTYNDSDCLDYIDKVYDDYIRSIVFRELP